MSHMPGMMLQSGLPGYGTFRPGYDFWGPGSGGPGNMTAQPPMPQRPAQQPMPMQQMAQMPQAQRMALMQRFGMPHPQRGQPTGGLNLAGYR